MNPTSSRVMFHLGRFVLGSALGVMVALSTACTHTMKVKASSSARIPNLSPAKIPLRVGLMVDPQFSQFEHRFKYQGDTVVFPFGPSLREQAISLSTQTFEQVTTSTNGAVPAGVDVILSPEVHRSGHAWNRGTFMFTLLVQWTVRDSANRQVLWMATVDAQAAASKKQVYQALFDDLAAKSYRAFRDSPEIQRLAMKTN